MDDFDSYINELKASVDIVEEISKDEPVSQRGRAWRGTRHDSLQVTPDKGLWNWHSRNIGGDIFSWCQEIRGWDFKRAVEEMARRYGVEPPDWKREDSAARLEAQRQNDVLTIAARYFVGKLRNSSDALSYCLSRGWTKETVKSTGVGLWDGDKKALCDHLKMHDVDLNERAARALLLAPANMIVYPHIELGRVVYLTYRGVKEKRHWNPPVDLIGDRCPFWNPAANSMRGLIAVVEGQGDAITLQQWNIPAVALCGVSIGDTGQGSKLAHQLAKHDVFWCTDSDNAGEISAKKAADILGPMIRIVTWPDHDANDWLINDPQEASEAHAKDLFDNAPVYAEILAKQIGQLPDYEKPEGLKRLMKMVARMDDHEQSVYRRSVSKAAGVSVSVFDKLLDVAIGDKDGEDDDDEEVHIPHATVGGMVDSCLLEMLYIPPDDQPANAVIMNGGQTLFAIRDGDGSITTKPFYDSGDLRFFPIDPGTPFIREGVVLFPMRIGDKVQASELIKRIRELIHKYVDVDEFYEALSAYYVLFSWFYDAFPTLSYLRVKGDAGTGKTRFLEVVGALCYRPLLMNAGASVSAMFRIMDVIRGTLVLDEGDFAKSDESADIAKLLNVGNQRRQGRISRAGSKETDFTPEFFNVYGPKVISTRKAYDDNAIESRCLTKETGAPTSRDDIPRNLPDLFWKEEVPELQALLLRYRLEHWTPNLNSKEIPIDSSIEPRLQQVTDSLKKMINDPEMLNELQGFIQRYNAQMVSKRGLETEAKLLEALMILYESQLDTPIDKQNYSLGDVASIANDLMDYENDVPIEQWSHYKTKGRDRRISSKGAGHMLSSNLNLQTHRPSHDNRRRYHVIFDEKRIFGLWRRFGLGTDASRDLLLNTWKTIQEMVAQEDLRRVQQQTGY